MTELKVTIKNLDKIQAKFAAMPVQITKGLNTAVSNSIKILQREAIQQAPVDRGNLRQNIKYKMTGIAKGEVVSEAGYSAAVHEGTRPHVITVKNKKVLANAVKKKIFGRTVRHPGTKANPFMQRAIDERKDDINDAFAAVIRDIIK